MWKMRVYSKEGNEVRKKYVVENLRETDSTEKQGKKAEEPYA